jgi:hypothetical protein
VADPRRQDSGPGPSAAEVLLAWQAQQVEVVRAARAWAEAREARDANGLEAAEADLALAVRVLDELAR